MSALPTELVARTFNNIQCLKVTATTEQLSQSLADYIAQNSQTIETLNSTLEHNLSSTGSLDERLKSLNTTLVTALRSITDRQDQGDNILTSITSSVALLNTVMENIKDSIEMVFYNINSVNEDHITLKNNLESEATKLTNAVQVNTNQNGRLTTLESSIQAFNSRVSDLSNQLAVFNSQIGTQATSITGLQTSKTSLGDNVTTLKQLTQNQTNAIGTLHNTTATLSNRTNALSETINELKERVSKLEARA